MFLKSFWIILLVMALVLVVGIASAQDATLETNTPTAESTVVPTEEVTPPVEAPEQPPVETPDNNPINDFLNTFMPYLTQIVIALFIGVVILAGAAIVVAGQGMPKWARDIARGTVSSGFEQAELIVAKTPSTIDDELLADLKRRVDELFVKMDQVVAATSNLPGQVG